MVHVGDIVKALETYAPPHAAEEWDNVGLQAGSLQSPVERVLLTVDVTPEAVEEAVQKSAGLMIAHHPLIFHPLNSLADGEPVSEMLISLVRADIALYVAHTNLDRAPVIGTAVALAEILGFAHSRAYDAAAGGSEGGMGQGDEYADDSGIMRIGELAAVLAAEEFACRVGAALGVEHVRLIGAADRTVRTVMMVPGSGGSMVKTACAAGVDALVTGDVGHHDALEALQRGLVVVDAGHLATERPVLAVLHRFLHNKWPKLDIHCRDAEPPPCTVLATGCN